MTAPWTTLYEDDDLIVIDKPAGLIVQDSHTHAQDTVESLLPHRDDLDRNGLVHRLDRDTSGVLAVARTSEAQARLQSQFAERRVHKVYTALVWGWPAEDHAVIDAPILRHPKIGYKFVVALGGREARTEWWVEERAWWLGQRVARLRVEPTTGRTHQIRVHLTALNHPLLGDGVYGRRKDPRRARLGLHAASLTLTHPRTGEPLTCTAPLPADLAAVNAEFRDGP